MPAMTAYQPIPIYLKPHDQKCGSGLAREGGLAVNTVDCVHIHCCGNGRLGFRLTAGHFGKE
ncbi:hypothetical protein, partial [Pseudomonas lactis]|uniref:hypothetical protein n=1 Tax=Pseudomonas lactis TaxID=1615674 RepID=UPI001E3B9BE3